MKFAIIPDIHLKRTDSLGIIGKDGMNTRLKDKLEAIHFCIDYAVKNSCDYVVFLGDIFETINPSEKLRQLFWKELAPILDRQIRIVLGNHDMTGSSYNLSGDKIICGDNIRIYNESQSENIENVVVNYVPYSESPEFNSKADIVFGHIEVSGAVMGSDNRNMVAEIKKSEVPGRFVCLGHIHKFQELSPGFTYLGSCTRCNFGEVSEKKFMCCCEVVGRGINYSYIEIPQRPMIVKEIKEDDKNNLYISEKIPQELDVEGALLKFKLVGSREWLRSIDKKSFSYRFKNALKVEFSDTKIDTDSVGTESNVMGMEERIRIYANKKRKKSYIDSGVEIMKQAKEIEV